MPKYERIPADAESPTLDTVDDISEALMAARAAQAKVRTRRVALREKRSEILAELADLDGDYAAAIEHVNRLERRLDRLQRRAAAGQHVKVGTARERARAGKGK